MANTMTKQEHEQEIMLRTIRVNSNDITEALRDTSESIGAARDLIHEALRNLDQARITIRQIQG